MPLINCSECQKEISDSAVACPHCGSPRADNTTTNRSVGVLLGIGILFIPLIFSWFTLRKGHSTLSRVVALLWAGSTILFIGGVNQGSEMIRKAELRAANVNVQEPESESVTKVNIRDILADYSNNEIGADNKYKGTVIEVSGTVSSIKKDILDSLYVTIGTGKQFEIPEIQAFFDDSMNSRLGELQKGQRLTVTCRVEGLMMNVLLKNCLLN